ncbi:spore germination protein KA [Pullulanibacillus camelliae]|uniref:Spore germination protein KA n=1 Tax=Pullulanibacillus camelliae TaxID=1707096 RepID=A0A8J2VP29_9BACL|nr:spore germination protein [Pullulanibacillus camelliae]GGE33530.1 spore germination protein KA [Pullulanibacillus camelliae]
MFKLKNKSPDNKPISQQDHPVYPDLQKNIHKVKHDLGESSDLVVRTFHLAGQTQITIGLLYIDGLIDQTAVQEFVLGSLMTKLQNTFKDKKINKQHLYDFIKESVLTISSVKDLQGFNDLYAHLLSGDAILLIDEHPNGMAAGIRAWEDRGVTETSSQNVIRGPKEAFSETLRTNTTLVRRRIKDPNLWIKTQQIGERTKTDIAVMYIKGVADENVIKEVHRRLDNIEIDAILESGYIEELIQDKTLTPFPTIFNSERPDSIAAGLLEGRVAIFVDGTPFVLMVPALFVQFLQSSEDYYQRADISTLLRILRYITLLMSLLVPSMYIALTTFHQEMIPTPLLISLASQREATPFPAFIEALIMEFTFEILREAGIRLPKAIGSAISIVGALVIGESAVQAGLISPAMVIVVSLTAISSFVTPAFNMAISIRMIRFPFMLLAASFGLYGIIGGLILLVMHLCSLSSFGVPYMAPFGPHVKQDQKDAILRVPQWKMITRPHLFKRETERQDQTNRHHSKMRSQRKGERT